MKKLLPQDKKNLLIMSAMYFIFLYLEINFIGVIALTGYVIFKREEFDNYMARYIAGVVFLVELLFMASYALVPLSLIFDALYALLPSLFTYLVMWAVLKFYKKK